MCHWAKRLWGWVTMPRMQRLNFFLVNILSKNTLGMQWIMGLILFGKDAADATWYLGSSKTNNHEFLLSTVLVFLVLELILAMGDDMKQAHGNQSTRFTPVLGWQYIACNGMNYSLYPCARWLICKAFFKRESILSIYLVVWFHLCYIFRLFFDILIPVSMFLIKGSLLFKGCSCIIILS